MAKKINQFDLDEVFRQLRTNIEFSKMDENIQIVNTVSTNPNEGKSTIASNLARICADKYNNVLLIDCDLRNPSLHRMLKTSNSTGLSNLLSHFDGNTSIITSSELKVLQLKSGKIFYFLSSGSRVPNPLELLSSNRFSKFLQVARREFDFIIIDCPPVTACSDAIPICNASDGTLFVCSSKETDKRRAREAVRDLQRNGAKLMGVCLTKVEDFASKHYNYYGYGDESTKRRAK
ncbi:CpsD/CapB family tyrosine-protein kinase [Floccifex sp.]|uniref:CpsD/CapB family tyrosine-protein kinase n=1 Tax=Floccifex sp. TaxID=2815810 RepID=UPI003F060D0E